MHSQRPAVVQLPADIAQARIVVVDDQAINLEYLERILRHAGYHHLSTTSSPDEALALCATIDPDIVLLDLHMPGLDGFAVLQAIEAARHPDAYLPVLVLTADVSPEAKQRALALGAKNFLTKPLDRIETLLRIRNLLETRLLHGQVLAYNQVLEARVRERTRALEQAEM